MIIDIQDKVVTITYEQSDTIGRSFRDEIKRNYKNFSSKNIINEFILNWWPHTTFVIFVLAIIIIYKTGELE